MASLAGTLLVAAALISIGGLRDTSGLIALSFIARYVGIASPVKILLGQPLDSHLFHPASSFLMVLLCSVEILAAYLLVRRVTIDRTFFPHLRDTRFIKMLATICLLCGVPVSLVTTLTAPDDPTLAGFRTFTDSFLMLGIIARTAYVCLNHGGRKLHDLPLALVLAYCFAFSMISNTKVMAYTGILAYGLTFVCVRRSLPLRLVARGAAGLAFCIIVLQPLVNSLRGTASMREKTLPERIDALSSFFKTESVFRRIKQFDEEQADVPVFMEYFGPAGMFASFADRIAIVQNADALKSGIDMNGPLGSRLITAAFVGLIPRVIDPDKDMTPMCDLIFWHAGVRSRDTIGFPTVGLIGGSYALAGWDGVLIAPFILMTLFFLVQKLWAGTSCDHLMALFFLVRHANCVAESDVTCFILILIRTVPLDLITFLIVFRVCAYFSSHGTRPVRTASPARPAAWGSSTSM
ncbi:MAG: hypothetical protein JO252_12420 [Planctomycetaceae bacterium]|nr:hypothetical protein [Planctomycetaceae bacterium]